MNGNYMDGRKKILLAVSTCVIGFIIILCAMAANTATKAATQPPIPKVGRLAQPRSLQQVGLPVDLTRTVIPLDNPQMPEKIALGQKLFFDGRLSADGSAAMRVAAAFRFG
jgi:cytochrome c peroxidase